MNGEVRICSDVAGEFADLVATRQAAAIAEARRSDVDPFRLGCSGGASGVACYERLAEKRELAWSSLACYFVDERCVDAHSPDANRNAIAHALGGRLEQLAGFYPMDCASGADFYEDLLRAHGPLDLVQLGFGPDGHTASLFPASSALSAPEERLVVTNVDPSGANPYARLTLTFRAIAMAPIVVFTVMGGEKAARLRALFDGEDFPAARVSARELIWLCDEEAASQLPQELFL